MGGSCSCTCVPVPPPEAPAQLLIQVVNIWPQALGSLSQQLCPPLTLTTMREVDGCCRLTTVLACAYARFTSSLRAKFGICAGVVALSATILHAHVVPETDGKGLHIGGRGRGPRVGARRTQGSRRPRRGGRRAAAAAGALRN